VIALDVADSKSVATLPAALTELKVTKLDVLVNNAGVNHSPPNASARPGLTELTVDNFLEIFRTNVVAVWDVSQTLLPFVRKAEHPRVVHISSIMGSIDKTASLYVPLHSPSSPLLCVLLAGSRELTICFLTGVRLCVRMKPLPDVVCAVPRVQIRRE
jgi:hypothetical protein